MPLNKETKANQTKLKIKKNSKSKFLLYKK